VGSYVQNQYLDLYRIFLFDIIQIWEKLNINIPSHNNRPHLCT